MKKKITSKDFVKEVDDDGEKYILRSEAFLVPDACPMILPNGCTIAEWKLFMQTNTKKPMKELVEKLRDYANIIEKFMVDKLTDVKNG